MELPSLYSFNSGRLVETWASQVAAFTVQSTLKNNTVDVEEASSHWVSKAFDFALPEVSAGQLSNIRSTYSAGCVAVEVLSMCSAIYFGMTTYRNDYES